MKIVRNLFLLVCLAVFLLSSCSKEEVRDVMPYNLEVNLTRANSDNTPTGGVSSSEQGDQIMDVMVWAFEMSFDKPIDIPALGFVSYTVPENSDYFNNITLNVPVKLFKESAKYRFVTVLNKSTFGEIVKSDGTELVLDENTSYYDLISARFKGNDNIMNSSVSALSPGIPAALPVSHWTDAEVSIVTDNAGNKSPVVAGSNDNTINIPVYRAVAKTQLFVKPMSDFELSVNSVTIVNKGNINEGMVLAYDWAVGSSNWWVEDGIQVSDSDSETSLISSPIYCADPQNETFVCGKMLFEHKNACSDNSGSKYYDVPSGKGYYYRLAYSIGDAEETVRYMPLPQVLRNHDYQIHITVKENAEIRVEYDVADWNQKVWELDFSSPQHTNLLPVPDESLNTKQGVPTVSYTAGTEAGAAVFYFKVKGPAGITWKPTLLNASSKDYEVRVYRVIENTDPQNPTLSKENITTAIDANTDYFYAVKVVAVNSSTVGRVKPVNLAISYDSKYSVGNTSLLVVNPNGFWAVPDGCTQDRFCVQIKHVQQ